MPNLSVFLKLYLEFKKKLKEIPAKTLIKLEITKSKVKTSDNIYKIDMSSIVAIVPIST